MAVAVGVWRMEEYIQKLFTFILYIITVQVHLFFRVDCAMAVAVGVWRVEKFKQKLSTFILYYNSVKSPPCRDVIIFRVGPK